MSALKAVSRASVVSGVLFLAGDVLSQWLFPNPARQQPHRKLVPPSVSETVHEARWIPEALKPALEKWDLDRSLKFAALGTLLHGPFFHETFRFLDWRFGHKKTLGTIALKIAVNQIFFAPVFNVAILSASAWLDGESAEDRIRTRFADIYTNSVIVWSTSNFVNFRFVPPAWRILYINLVGIGWNIYLSWATSTTLQVAPVAGVLAKEL
ncbi:uncharacterized protein BJ171DRAFT_584278 [Polychytrium aggregatum]|uniref:uncharacterized protein n=1 Tax=Polychytrium aggregatum TaxID=110093 RepID=UPI0022FE5A3A|nr:uncharacterized protein BJ171DRAFT_584278 [Polychytrium aggregatum]KAI9202372.1 hypothetical protein BJ171DRAFT_584278 [Polychytrium aggregatum]